MSDVVFKREDVDDLIHRLYVARHANQERSKASNDPHQINYYNGKADGLTEAALEIERAWRCIDERYRYNR